MTRPFGGREDARASDDGDLVSIAVCLALQHVRGALSARLAPIVWRREIGTVLETWWHRHRYRRELERLIRNGPHLIEDIGLSRIHADREVAKPFWRP